MFQRMPANIPHDGMFDGNGPLRGFGQTLERQDCCGLWWFPCVPAPITTDPAANNPDALNPGTFDQDDGRTFRDGISSGSPEESSPSATGSSPPASRTNNKSPGSVMSPPQSPTQPIAVEQLYNFK
jgi:hypothetical protein